MIPVRIQPCLPPLLYERVYVGSDVHINCVWPDNYVIVCMASKHKQYRHVAPLSILWRQEGSRDPSCVASLAIV